MVNFLLIGAAAYLFLRTLCPAWDLGFRKKGLIDGIKKYGIIGALVAAVGFLAFYVGLSPFNRHPSIEKVLIEGVVYYIGVAIMEELYVRGLLLNLIEKMLVKSENSALPYCFSSINGYADLTLYIAVPVYIIWGIYSFIELKRSVKFPL